MLFRSQILISGSFKIYLFIPSQCQREGRLVGSLLQWNRAIQHKLVPRDVGKKFPPSLTYKFSFWKKKLFLLPVILLKILLREFKWERSKDLNFHQLGAFWELMRGLTRKFILLNFSVEFLSSRRRNTHLSQPVELFWALLKINTLIFFCVQKQLTFAWGRHGLLLSKISPGIQHFLLLSWAESCHGRIFKLKISTFHPNRE